MEVPGTLTADESTVQVDVAMGVARFTNITIDALGSYAIKVHIKSSTGSYSIMKRAVLHVITSQLKVVVKKSIQLKFAADFELIRDKLQQELFQAALENHFYKIYRTNQVIFSNFKFWEGAWLGGAVFLVFGSLSSCVLSLCILFNCHSLTFTVVLLASVDA